MCETFYGKTSRVVCLSLKDLMISVRLGNRATLDHVALGLMVFVMVE